MHKVLQRNERLPNAVTFSPSLRWVHHPCVPAIQKERIILDVMVRDDTQLPPQYFPTFLLLLTEPASHQESENI